MRRGRGACPVPPGCRWNGGGAKKMGARFGPRAGDGRGNQPFLAWKAFMNSMRASTEDSGQAL